MTSARTIIVALAIAAAIPATTRAQDVSSATPDASAQGPTTVEWQYGGFVDVGYLRDFNEPSNHLFRSRGTAFHVNEWDLNMAGRSSSIEPSRWGTELLVQEARTRRCSAFRRPPNLAGAD
jgi:hypothetical protein